MVLMIFFVFSGFGETWSHQVKVGQTIEGGGRYDDIVSGQMDQKLPHHVLPGQYRHKHH